VAVASAGPYANLHLDPDTTMPARCPFCRPTNSVKALKAQPPVRKVQTKFVGAMPISPCRAKWN